jgi:hypothetical protein
MIALDSVLKKNKREMEIPVIMAPQEGLEPPTLWLTAICSTD